MEMIESDLLKDSLNVQSVGETTIATEIGKESKKRLVVGAWRNLSEFRKVYSWIYAKEATNDSKRRALSQIRVWNLRRSSLCPAAVLATSIILQAQLEDSAHISPSSPQAQNISSLYSNALIRFFNYMSSIIQTYNLRSMYDTAKDLGLNSFVVDLRHLCAHGQVTPPLHILRKTSQYCMSWLHDYYWDIQNNIMKDIDCRELRYKDKSTFLDSLSDLLGVYDTALECHMNDAETLKKAKKILSKDRFAMFQTYVEHRDLQDFEAVFQSVVKDLYAVIKRENNIKDLGSLFVHEMMRMQFLFLAGDVFASSEEDIERLINATKKLFNAVSVFGYLERFVYDLFFLMESPGEPHFKRKSATFWSIKIIEAYVALRTFVQIYKNECSKNVLFKGIDFNKMTVDATNYLMQMVLLNHGVNFNQTIILSESVRYPWVWHVTSGYAEARVETINVYTAEPLKVLLNLIHPALTPEDMAILVQQIDLMSLPGQSVKSVKVLGRNNSEIEIYTKKDILELLKQYETMPGNLEGEKEMGLWTAVKDNSVANWRICPLGRMPFHIQ